MALQDSMYTNCKKGGAFKMAGGRYKRPTKEEYAMYLNEQGIPEMDRAVNGGRIPDRTKAYGDWLRKNDLTAFQVGYNDYVRDWSAKNERKRT